MPKVFNHTDFNQTELRNAVIQKLAAPPSSPVLGQIYYDTTLKELGTYNGAGWDYATIAGVASVAGSAPITSSGGTTPTIAITPASGSAPGSMSASDKTKLDAAAAAATNSAIVQRDSSGNFAANTVTANLTGTASNASNLNSQSPGYYLARANHTGTQTSSTISDFDTQVNTHRLDQLAASTSAVNLNNQRLINVPTTPTQSTDAVNQAYVDARIDGNDNKGSVRAASTTNINLAAPGSTIDGVTMATGNLFLAKDQTTASQNGLYVWNGAAVPATRATNADTNAEVTSGLYTFVEEGTANGSNGYTLTTANPLTLGTTNLSFTQTSGAGQIVSGAGLTKTGNQLDVGQGTGLVVAADSIGIDTTVVPRKFQQNIGDGTSTSIAVMHNLGTRDLVWSVYLNSSTYDDVVPDVQRTSVNVATFIFAAAPAANQYRVVIQG